jgi:phosphatidylglycerophosphate synthase
LAGESDDRGGGFKRQAANLLSASRFVFAALWLAAFLSGKTGVEVLGTIAFGAALSDVVDGLVARRMRSANKFGRWFDSVADIVFVLTALSCEATARAIPVYIPVLIAASFTQYVVDSVVISDSSVPVRSRLGHWGGIVNFALVIVLAFAPPPRWPGVLVRQISPLIAIFYLAAMVERAMGYRKSARLAARTS